MRFLDELYRALFLKDDRNFENILGGLYMTFLDELYRALFLKDDRNFENILGGLYMTFCMMTFFGRVLASIGFKG